MPLLRFAFTMLAFHAMPLSALRVTPMPLDAVTLPLSPFYAAALLILLPLLYAADVA